MENKMTMKEQLEVDLENARMYYPQAELTAWEEGWHLGYQAALTAQALQAQQKPSAWLCCVPGQSPVLLFDEPSDERYPPQCKEALYSRLQSEGKST